MEFTLRDGATFSATIDPNQSLNEVMRSIETQSGGRVKVELDRRGTGLTLTDLTGGSGNLIIEGTSGADTAASLGLSTGASGVASATFSSGNLQRQYVSRATLLSSLNSGKGIGTGEILIRDAQGITSAKITIGSELKTVGDMIQHLNTRGVAIEARINAKGDGIEIVEAAGATGSNKIKITDTAGTVAKALGIAGEATGTGADNRLDGSAERKVSFLATDTLQQVIDKINQAGVGVAASVIRDGGGATPFRVNLTSSSNGSNGRFLVDTGALDMGWRSLDAGNDARLFFGSADPARGVAVTSSTNQLDGIIPGLRIDAKSVSSTPVSLTVQSDNEAVISAVKVFVETFNTAIARVDFQSKYDAATERGGPLLGDSTALELRSGLFRLVQAPMAGATGQFSRLTQVGVKVVAGGKIELNEAKLRDALQTDFESVESLFTARDVAEDTTTTLAPGVTVRNPNASTTFTRLGIMGQFEQLAERYTTTVNGVLTNRNRGLDDQMKLQRDRVTSFTNRLNQRRAILERQFQAMESAIQKLQTQSSSLSGISRAG
jgi:flagellar hook-associated protein 2